MNNLSTQDWYVSLLDEVQATFTEAVFTSRFALIEGYHQVGKLLRENENIPMTDLVNKCAEDMQVSSRKLWYAVQFYDKYPRLDLLPEGKNISWSKIKSKYLPKETKDQPEPVKENTCKLCRRIIYCPHCQ